MKATRNILGWLGQAEEQSTLVDAEKHIEEIYRTVTRFAEAVKAFVNGDLNGKTVAIEEVRAGERAADAVRAKIVTHLSEGLLLPPDREDLLRFAKNMDKIADWTSGAARLLGYIEEKLPDNILKNIAISTELIVVSVARLRGAIHAITRNDLEEALRECAEVDRIEHEADDQKRTLIDAIIHASLSPTSLLLCYNLAENLEGVTDRVETSADAIRMLAAKAR